MGYRGYGLPMGEIISEGNIGLMQAVKRFDPERGFRLATYALWWIKAAIQEYVLRSWSLVKIGTTVNQKRLFFNLRRLKNKIQAFESDGLKHGQIQQIAAQLNVSPKEVVDMDQRLSGDYSLNNFVGEEEGQTWQDSLIDNAQNQEEVLLEQDELEKRRLQLADALKNFSSRDREIFKARRLNAEPATLQDLSKKFGISRERVRQIEAKTFEKLKRSLMPSLPAYSAKPL